MEVTGLECVYCGDIIYSRAHHDFHWCSCQETAVDGGFDYLRCIGQGKPIKVDVDATKRDLYNDWNEGKDEYGHILSKESKIKRSVATSTAIETGQDAKELIKQSWRKNEKNST